MYIDKVAVAFPSRTVTNEDVVREIIDSSGANPDIKRLGKLIERTLDSIGTSTRRWLAEDETPLSITLKACNLALSGLSDIDAVIYASVYSDIVEPASANVIAAKLGLDNIEAFDMKAACDGWMKALKVAQAMMACGEYRRVLIVNSEFSLVPHYAIRPYLFSIDNAEQLKWRLPAYTIGEAATATVVSAMDDDWEFKTLTRNELFDLCSVSAPFYDRSRGVSERVGVDGGGWFTSWAADLSGAGVPLAVDTFKKSEIDAKRVDILFTHASGTKDWMNIAEQIGLRDKIFDIHPRYGNLVSASVPAAMAVAEEDGRLQRGSRVALLVASAGMCASAVDFIY